MGIKRKIPYRNHAYRHLPGGTDPLSLTPDAQFFQYVIGSNATISDGVQTRVVFNTLAVNTVNTDDFTVAYTNVGGSNPRVSVTTHITRSSVWLFGLHVEWSLTDHGSDFESQAQVNCLAGDGAGNTGIDFMHLNTGSAFFGPVFQLAFANAYLLTPTAGDRFSITGDVYQFSGGNQSIVKESDPTINGTNLWGIRIT